MCNKKYRYTIIIPHYKIINLLERALNSIPDREDIQILIVDDNSGIEKREFDKLNKFKNAHCQIVLLEENRGAGFARNEALKKSDGQWLLFLDADDFFEEDAFFIFDKYQDSKDDIIYFNTRSVYSESLLPSNRFSIYKSYIEFCDNTDVHKLNLLKFAHSVPAAKMIRHSLVSENNIVFDETYYCNDSMFAVKAAINSKSIYVDKSVVYVVTEREGSLVTNPKLEAVKIRYEVQLRVNKLIREVGMSQYQNSLLAYWQQALKFGFPTFLNFIRLGIKYSGFNIYTLYLGRRRVLKMLNDLNKK